MGNRRSSGEFYTRCNDVSVPLWQHLRQLLCVATVRRDLLARLSRNQRRRHDIALDAHLRQCQYSA